MRRENRLKMIYIRLNTALRLTRIEVDLAWRQMLTTVNIAPELVSIDSRKTLCNYRVKIRIIFGFRARAPDYGRIDNNPENLRRRIVANDGGRGGRVCQQQPSADPATRRDHQRGVHVLARAR